MTTKRSGVRYDIDALKAQAAGRWLEIVPALSNIGPQNLDGRHGPCPFCKGTDRYNAYKDFAVTGGVRCNKCHPDKNSDGFATLMWANGWELPEAIKAVGDYIGATPEASTATPRPASTNNKAPLRCADHVAFLDADKARPLIEQWAASKEGVTADAAVAAGVRAGYWPAKAPKEKQQAVVAFSAFVPSDWDNPSALLLYRADGQEFPAGGGLSARKTHLVRGSKDGLIVVGGSAALDAAGTVWKCEGIPDALALSPHLPEGHVAITNVCGAKSSPPTLAAGCKGKAVMVVHDADAAGVEGAEVVKSRSEGVASEVVVVKLPYEVADDHGRDLRDWLNEGGDFDELLALAGGAAETTATVESTTTIFVTPDETAVVDSAIEFLATVENVYQRGGLLVQIVADSSPPVGVLRERDVARIARITQPRLRETVSRATWVRDTDGGMQRIHPTDWAVKAIEARGQWFGIPHLETVVESPVLRPDGTILQTPGYDATTGIYYATESTFPSVAEKPTASDVNTARDALLEVVCDFPFASAEHQSAWMAGVLTPLARYAFPGPSPLFLVDANVRGSGKSLLSDTISLVALGRDAARMANPRDDEECRKRITSIALAGEPLILIDNISGTLGCASLDAALTATTWSDRILGRSEMTGRLPLLTTWYASGNNVILTGDTSRRVVHIRLESPLENPEERGGFQHANLTEWVRAQRSRLVTAALTILRGFRAAGSPDQKLNAWGSFEGWSDSVRQAVVWAGMSDPGKTRVELAAQGDREAGALRALLTGWGEIDTEGKGLTAAEARRELESDGQLTDNFRQYDTLRFALSELISTRDGRLPDARRIGIKLNHLRGRVIDGKCLVRSTVHNTAVWAVRAPESAKTWEV